MWLAALCHGWMRPSLHMGLRLAGWTEASECGRRSVDSVTLSQTSKLDAASGRLKQNVASHAPRECKWAAEPSYAVGGGNEIGLRVRCRPRGHDDGGQREHQGHFQCFPRELGERKEAKAQHRFV